MKIGCIVCHPVGSKATREFVPSLGTFNSSVAAWEHRFKVGQDHSILETTPAERHLRRGQELRHAARPADVRGLDRSHRRRGGAGGAAAAARARAQPGADDVGLGHAHQLHPRRGHDGSPPPDRQSERLRLRQRLRAGQDPHSRSGQAHDLGVGEPAGARPARAVGEAANHRGAVAVLGRRDHLEGSGQPQPSDDGRARTRLAGLAASACPRTTRISASAVRATALPATIHCPKVSGRSRSTIRERNR